MKTLIYNEGPPSVTMGAAGEFKRGEPKPVAAELAARLLNKTSIRFAEVKPAGKKEA